MIPYDKRSGKIWYNGELVDWSNVKVVFLREREFMMVQSSN